MGFGGSKEEFPDVRVKANMGKMFIALKGNGVFEVLQ